MIFILLYAYGITLGCDGPPYVSITVLVLGSVLDHPVAHVVVLDGEDRQGLEPPPAHRHDQGIPVLEDPGVPAVLLQPQPNVAHLVKI